MSSVHYLGYTAALPLPHFKSPESCLFPEMDKLITHNFNFSGYLTNLRVEMHPIVCLL